MDFRLYVGGDDQFSYLVWRESADLEWSEPIGIAPRFTRLLVALQRRRENGYGGWVRRGELTNLDCRIEPETVTKYIMLLKKELERVGIGELVQNGGRMGYRLRRPLEVLFPEEGL